MTEEGPTGAVASRAPATYASLGAAERFVWVPYGAGHVFRRDMRGRSHTFFDRWLRAPTTA